MARAWLALVVLSTVVSGCIGGGGSRSTGQATMGDLLPVADAVAKAWDPSAQLMMVAGWEISNATVERIQGGNVTVPRDGAIGDGKTTLWAYSYADAGLSKVLFLAVAANETVVFRFEMRDPGNVDPAAAEEFRLPTDTWKIDSDEALAKARANASFSATENQLTRPTFMYALFGMPEFPGNHSVFWVVVALDFPSYERLSSFEDDEDLDFEDVAKYVETTTIAVANVDAISGEVFQAGILSDFGDPGEDVAPPADPHAGHDMGPRTLHEMEESGQVTLLEDAVTFPLPVAEDGTTIEGNFTYGQGTVPGGATMYIEAADGTEIYSSGGTGVTIKETRVGVFAEDVPAGDYTITVEIGNFAATADWSFDLRVTATGMPPMGNETTGEEQGGRPSLRADLGALFALAARAR